MRRGAKRSDRAGRRAAPARDAQPQFIRYIHDQLNRWAPVEVRRMFGGHGIFLGGTMFALIYAETLYFRTDASNRGDFEAAGMAPFSYRRNGKEVALGYHEVPPDLLDENEQLGLWAERAFAAAARKAEAKKRRSSNSKSSRGRSRRS